MRIGPELSHALVDLIAICKKHSIEISVTTKSKIIIIKEGSEQTILCDVIDGEDIILDDQ